MRYGPNPFEPVYTTLLKLLAATAGTRIVTAWWLSGGQRLISAGMVFVFFEKLFHDRIFFPRAFLVPERDNKRFVNDTPVYAKCYRGFSLCPVILCRCSGFSHLHELVWRKAFVDQHINYNVAVGECLADYRVWSYRDAVKFRKYELQDS